jgi:4-diphosphocytidyl-2-C-methyl-D-erythritol kinase
MAAVTAAPGRALRLSAPAKLNLFLHVTARRPDGYHELETVFQLLDLADIIDLHRRDDGRIERTRDLAGVPADADLVVRAARRLQAETGSGFGADIAVDKRLPLGGGLGGGSSDAATVLVGLNALWGCGLGLDRLATLGVALGADVPVFVRGASAYAEGIGEQLQPLALPERHYVVVHPGLGVSTAEIFQAPELTRNSPKTTIRGFVSGAATHNDLQAVVVARQPRVREALDWLGQFGAARMTGSGACVFAAFENAEDARRIAAQAPASMRAFVARGINRSPLHEEVEAAGLPAPR